MNDKRPIHPQHEDQAGWVYVRVHKAGQGYCVPNYAPALLSQSPQSRLFDQPPTAYVDTHDDSRIISSSRVEEDVETGDYLKRCADEGLTAASTPSIRRGKPDYWCVFRLYTGNEVGRGTTLPRAYHKYHELVGDGVM